MRTRAIALLVAVLGGGCGSKEEAAEVRVASKTSATKPADVSEADYAALLIAALKKQGGGDKLHFDAKESLITDGTMRISTKNIYAEFLEVDPENRPAEVARIAGSFKTATDDKDPTLDAVRAKLLPAVRAGIYFDWQLQMGDLKPEAVKHVAVFLPIGEMTGVGVAIDDAEAMQIATDKQLTGWGIGISEAVAIATKNLVAKGITFQEVKPGVWSSPAHDSYDSSRLLMFDEIAKLKLKGTVVAMIPNRDTLYLASSLDAKALLAMADLAEKAAEEPRPIHTIPLCLTGTTWAECEPAPTPAVKQRMHAIATQGRESLYQDQHDKLQKKLGEDVFVASYTVLQAKDGRLASYATWTHTVPTLLPRTDLVGFVEMTGDEPDAEPKVLGFVPWERAKKILGTHMRPDGRNPQRWATGDYFPTKAELAALAPSANPFP